MRTKKRRRPYAKRPSQKRLILTYLKEHPRGLTPLIARAVFRVQSLSSRVCELRRDGYKIDSRIEVDDLGQRFARYTLRRS